VYTSGSYATSPSNRSIEPASTCCGKRDGRRSLRYADWEPSRREDSATSAFKITVLGFSPGKPLQRRSRFGSRFSKREQNRGMDETPHQG
jgi:hypothetical protein